MEWAALVTWVLTAGGGFVLFATWIARGGVRQQRAAGNRIRPPLIFSHFGLAATGLVLWIIYIATDSDALAWIALGVLAVVALLGWAMFAIWYQQRRRPVGEVSSATNPVGTTDLPAEQHFPVSIVTLHGFLAVTTVVLVFLTAIGVGD